MNRPSSVRSRVLASEMRNADLHNKGIETRAMWKAWNCRRMKYSSSDSSIQGSSSQRICERKTEKIKEVNNRFQEQKQSEDQIEKIQENRKSSRNCSSLADRPASGQTHLRGVNTCQRTESLEIRNSSCCRNRNPHHHHHHHHHNTQKTSSRNKKTRSSNDESTDTYVDTNLDYNIWEREHEKQRRRRKRQRLKAMASSDDCWQPDLYYTEVRRRECPFFRVMDVLSAPKSPSSPDFIERKSGKPNTREGRERLNPTTITTSSSSSSSSSSTSKRSYHRK